VRACALAAVEIGGGLLLADGIRTRAQAREQVLALAVGLRCRDDVAAGVEQVDRDARDPDFARIEGAIAVGIGEDWHGYGSLDLAEVVVDAAVAPGSVTLVMPGFGVPTVWPLMVPGGRPSRSRRAGLRGG
jgi:hypothetical protein